MLREGEIATLINEAHEAQEGRVASQTKARSRSSSSSTVSKAARAAIMTRAGAMGRA